MRGADERAGSLFSYVDLESRIPPKRPLPAIRAIVNEALSTLDADFAGADRGFDTRDFVEDLRELGATPHVAQNRAGR